jgi:hypothetical protein
VSLAEWDNFYVIVGSSAAALTGLMFVVIALMSDFKANENSIHAFGTPTVVHFGAVLLQSAIIAAPWPSLLGARIALAVYGAAGVIYIFVVLRRARQQKDYKPVFEDWLFHTILPILAYGGIVVASLGLAAWPRRLFFTIAAASLLLLFVGLHNAWDTVTFIVVTRPGREPIDQAHPAEAKPHTEKKARHH